MKLYFSPGACSLAPNIVAHEAGIALELVKVDLARKTVAASGAELRSLSAKAMVPLLEIAPGELLSEGPVICQYLADRAGALALMPAPGSSARYRVLEWQNYITSDLHKMYSVLFSQASSEAKAYFADVLHKKYRWVDDTLAHGPHLTGAPFTAADAYLFTVTRWAAMVGLDLGSYRHLADFMHRVQARPSVQAALRAEQLAS